MIDDLKMAKANLALAMKLDQKITEQARKIERLDNENGDLRTNIDQQEAVNELQKGINMALRKEIGGLQATDAVQLKEIHNLGKGNEGLQYEVMDLHNVVDELIIRNRCARAVALRGTLKQYRNLRRTVF
ncbi:hypothetical protein PHYPSEUDO_000406 [Phytophthora pseudosyringae]|uniref:Uncharacterized protein n=1 Tax=Phytophthora pseudosyringae TaxID=221518 RepID=A0A8T1V3U7_9STRA|nr:hypothetical protein PHYPSEUDO_000406 [Phytophthora pseudosyringae]